MRTLSQKQTEGGLAPSVSFYLLQGSRVGGLGALAGWSESLRHFFFFSFREKQERERRKTKNQVCDVSLYCPPPGRRRRAPPSYVMAAGW